MATVGAVRRPSRPKSTPRHVAVGEYVSSKDAVSYAALMGRSRVVQ